MSTAVDYALRDLQYATTLAIELLHKLDQARAQVKTLKAGEDGRMIVAPGNALALNGAVENAFRSCRNITKVEDK